MDGLPNDLIPLPTMPYDERPESMPLDIDECRTAIWRCRGNITKAAELLKITPLRLRNFVRKSVFLTEESKEAQEQLADIAEENVYDALVDTEDKGRRDAMSRYVLDRVGRSRGYGPSGAGVALNLPNKGKMAISWADDTPIAGDDAKIIEHGAAAE